MILDQCLRPLDLLIFLLYPLNLPLQLPDVFGLPFFRVISCRDGIRDVLHESLLVPDVPVDILTVLEVFALLRLYVIQDRKDVLILRYP